MKIRVLLAEDEPDLRISAEFRLESAGFEVIIAEDGREALELIKSERPDLALMDIRMPYLTGIKVSRIMKADEELKGIPVILMTASTEYLLREADDVHGAVRREYIISRGTAQRRIKKTPESTSKEPKRAVAAGRFPKQSQSKQTAAKGTM